MWIALTRTAADAYVKMADDYDLHFRNMETQMEINKIWLLTLVLETVQCTCNGNGIHENETQKSKFYYQLLFWLGSTEETN